MQRDIKLYGYATSPYVMKVGVYLKYKKLDYTHVHVRPGTNEQIRFTNQTQVPVLEIDGEWRTESALLGVWLDELFPDQGPLLPKPLSDLDKVTTIDGWISHQLIPARFMEAIHWTNPINNIRSGWRLAKIVHGGTPIPLTWRWIWPFVVRNAPFIRAMEHHFPNYAGMAALRQRIINQFLEHLQDGPYLGGQKQPSLADMSAYPSLISGYLMGLHGANLWLRHKEILDWMARVQSHLPDNPLCCDDRFIVRDFPF